MIELVERIFMNKNKKLNKAMDIISIGLLTIVMVLLSQYTIISLALIPVALAIFFIRKDMGDLLGLVVVMGILTFVFNFTKEYYILGLSQIILGLCIAFVINRDYEDIKSLILVFLLTGLILNLGYFYLIKVEAIDLNEFIDQFIQIVEQEGLEYPREALESALKTIPAILGVIALIYSLIALKTTRNYLNYKDGSIREFSKINKLRLTIKEVVLYLVFTLILILIGKSLELNLDLIQSNAISLGISLVQINGLFTLDYVMERRRSKGYRIFTWILIILLFSFLSIFFLIIGAIDIAFNLRGALHARK